MGTYLPVSNHHQQDDEPLVGAAIRVFLFLLPGKSCSYVVAPTFKRSMSWIPFGTDRVGCFRLGVPSSIATTNQPGLDPVYAMRIFPFPMPWVCVSVLNAMA